jgi:hypothetical protein
VFSAGAGFAGSLSQRKIKHAMKTLLRTIVLSIAAVSLAGLTGCTTHHPSAPSALCGIRDLDGPQIPQDFTGTLQRTRRTRAATHVVQVNSVESACCATFDRVVFDFDGLRLPPVYTIEYVDGPIRQCGSGQTVAMQGNARLKISFDTAQAHTDAGQATITDRNRRLQCPNLRQLVVTCDFEGKVEIVLGLNSKRPYRAVELLNDSKLVVDVKH